MNRDHYEIAKRNPECREELLKRISIGRYEPFVRNIIYFEGKVGDRIMETYPDPEKNRSLDIFSIIKVSDYAFDNYSWNEFLNVLIPHEGLHCLQNYFQSALPGGEIKKLNFGGRHNFNCSEQEIMQEIEAHKNQISHPTFPGCSEKFKASIINWLNFYKSA